MAHLSVIHLRAVEALLMSSALVEVIRLAVHAMRVRRVNHPTEGVDMIVHAALTVVTRHGAASVEALMTQTAQTDRRRLTLMIASPVLLQAAASGSKCEESNSVIVCGQ